LPLRDKANHAIPKDKKMTERICKRCGGSLTEVARFCVGCGYAFGKWA
jgi:hypothetical protein